MGIKGLTKFINDRANLYFENYELRDCSLLIDGHSISCNLYNWKHWQFDARSNNSYGGDYDKYAYIVENFFGMLKEVNVTPIVVFDGGFEQRKLPTILNRMQDKIKIADYLNPKVEASHPKKVVFPLFLREAFKDILRNLDIEMVMCRYEGDTEIASIAKLLNCPVLTLDSDYFLFGANYIPFNTIDSKIRSIENWRTGTYKCIACKIYKIEKLLEDFDGLQESSLHLLPVLMGNDYIDKTLFNTFLMSLNLSSETWEDQIQIILSWLKCETTESAIRKILKTFNTADERELILQKVKIIMSGYYFVESKLLKYLSISFKNDSKHENFDFTVLEEEIKVKTNSVSSESIIVSKDNTESNNINSESSMNNIQDSSKEESLEESSIGANDKISDCEEKAQNGNIHSPEHLPKEQPDLNNVSEANSSAVENKSETDSKNSSGENKTESKSNENPPETATENSDANSSAVVNKSEADSKNSSGENKTESKSNENPPETATENSEANSSAVENKSEADSKNSSVENKTESKSNENLPETATKHSEANNLQEEGEEIQPSYSFNFDESHLEKKNPKKNPVSKLFLKNFTKCQYPSSFMDILTQNNYYCIPQIENHNQEHSHSLSLDVLCAIHKILTNGEASDFTVVARGEGSSVKWFPQEKYTSNVPSLEQIEELTLQGRREIFLSILNIDTNFVSLLEHFPTEWHTFLISLKYALSKTTFETPLIYSLLLCFIILNYVDQRIGFYRSVERYKKKYFSFMQSLPSINEHVPFRADKNCFYYFPTKDCIIFMQKVIHLFSVNPKENAQTFDKNLIHSMAQIQSVFLHVKYLNALLKNPYPNLLIHQIFDGTFVYNLTKSFKEKSAELQNNYLNVFFKDCPSFFAALKYVLNMLSKQIIL